MKRRAVRKTPVDWVEQYEDELDWLRQTSLIKDPILVEIRIRQCEELLAYWKTKV